MKCILKPPSTIDFGGGGVAGEKAGILKGVITWGGYGAHVTRVIGHVTRKTTERFYHSVVER
jgi:hypothetical protein